MDQTDRQYENETNQLFRLAEKVTGISRAGGIGRGRCRDELEPAIELCVLDDGVVKMVNVNEVGEGSSGDEFFNC